MKHLAFVLGLALALLVASPTLAAPRIVTLSVPGMSCPSCPVTIRKALDRLQGVHVLSADLAKKMIKVRIVNSHVTNREITTTTANAGFPSTVVKDAHQ